MYAKRIVRHMLEDGEAPDEFLGRNPDLYPKGAPTHRFGFNLGEGNFRLGIAFGIEASSEQEALHKANTFIRKFFFESGRRGGFNLPNKTNIEGIGEVTLDQFRVYIDDEFWITAKDIVTVDEIEHPPVWREIEGGGDDGPDHVPNIE